MNRTKDELLIECIKQFEHIENVLGYNRLTTTRSLINEINQALTIPVVVRQSEQLFCGVEGGFCPYEESDRKCRAEHKCINQVAK